jgi:hypothetical protein
VCWETALHRCCAWWPQYRFQMLCSPLALSSTSGRASNSCEEPVRMVSSSRGCWLGSHHSGAAKIESIVMSGSRRAIVGHGSAHHLR